MPFSPDYASFHFHFRHFRRYRCRDSYFACRHFRRCLRQRQLPLLPLAIASDYWLRCRQLAAIAAEPPPLSRFRRFAAALSRCCWLICFADAASLSCDGHCCHFAISAFYAAAFTLRRRLIRRLRISPFMPPDAVSLYCHTPLLHFLPPLSMPHTPISHFHCRHIYGAICRHCIYSRQPFPSHVLMIFSYAHYAEASARYY